MTAGPDGIRGSGSNHLSALAAPGPNGVSRSPVQPVGIKLCSPLQFVLRFPLPVLVPGLPFFHAVAIGARYVSSLDNKAQAIRAVLLAMATVTKRAGRRSSKPLTQSAPGAVLARA